MKAKKNIFVFLSAISFLLLGLSAGRLGPVLEPAVALADDDDDDDERDERRERDEDEEEERAPAPVPKPAPAPASVPAVKPAEAKKVSVPKAVPVTTFIQLPDQIIEKQITTTVYDSDGDGVFDSEDSAPDIHDALIVSDQNFNGVADKYES
jgi:hypothetical protein